MSGLMGKKIGMTQIFNDEGEVTPVTVIEAGPCIVTQVKTREKDGYDAVQLGFMQAKKVNKPKEGHLKDKKLKHLREFKIEKPEEFKLGQEIKVDIFKPKDLVKIKGKSIGKGFAGTVKRWHFSRGPMSHGSKSHRRPGSIGAGTTPGRVFKGTRMAGRLGNRNVTQKGLEIVAVDLEKNLLLVRGSVPGAGKNLVEIRKQ